MKITVILETLVFFAVKFGETRPNMAIDIIFFSINEGLSLNSSNSNNSNVELVDKNEKYDHLVMSQQWPPTTCWDLNQKWHNNIDDCSPCDMPESKTDWTLHGLWSSNSKGKHPSYCSNTKFNIKQLNKTLIAQMEEKWSTLKLNSTNEIFWEYEWNKHGTCASNLPSTDTLPKYFSKSVQLLDQYNVGKILANAGILPGKKYDFQDVAYVIGKTLGVRVDIDCAVHLITEESYLCEIRICFNTCFQLIDCPAIVSDCKKKVWYPEIQSGCGKVTEQWMDLFRIHK